MTASEKALRKAKNYFDYSNRHVLMQKWRVLSREGYGFFDGTYQWEEQEKAKLKRRNQPALTINKIKSRVDRLVGMEVQSRTRFAFRSHLASYPGHHFIANALSRWGLYVQEREDIPKKNSWGFKDKLITGIGWNGLYRDPFNDQIKCEYVHPFNLLWDVDDLSPDLSNMQYVCRLRWYPSEVAQMIWPKHRKFFKEMFDRYMIDTVSGVNGELAARHTNYVNVYGGDRGDTSKALVVEVQYKENKTCFYGTDEQGFEIKTFDEEEALKFLPEKDINERKASQIIRVVFCGEQLLEYAPLYPNIPDQQDFSYIPFVNSRRYEDGIPDAWIEVFKDPQREYNYRKSKLISNLNSKRIILGQNAFPGKTADEIAFAFQEYGIIFAEDPRQVIIDNDANIAGGQFNLIEMANKEIEDVSGMYDDLMGKKTDAVSGVAIQSRQAGAVKNQTSQFDDFKYSQKRMGRQLLNLAQGQWAAIFNSNVLTQEDNAALAHIAIKQDKKGEPVLLNDIRSIPLDIYVEQSPNYESSFEENKDALNQIQQSPQAGLIMQSARWMASLGVRDAEEIAKENQAIRQREAQMQAAVKATPAPTNAQPSPTPTGEMI